MHFLVVVRQAGQTGCAVQDTCQAINRIVTLPRAARAIWTSMNVIAILVRTEQLVLSPITRLDTLLMPIRAIVHLAGRV